MKPCRPFMQGLKFAALLALALGLTGCGVWLGDKEAPPLPGERVAVLFPESDQESAQLVRPVVLPAAQPRADWPQAGGNARHDSGSVQAAAALQQVWAVPSSAGFYNFSTAPVIAGGRVFTLDADYVLSAYAQESGRQIWSVKVADPEGPGEAFGGGLAFEDGQLFLTTGYGLVAAYSSETGAETWRQSVGVPIRAAPVVADGVVLAVTVDNSAIAHAAADGRKLWMHQGFSDAAGLVGIGVPAIAGGIAVVPQSSGDLRALRLPTGDLLWEKSLASGRRMSRLADFAGIRADPVISDGVVYAASNSGRLAALDLPSGVELWQRRGGGINTPLLAGDSLFFLANDGQLMALGRKDGSLRWKVSLPVWKDPVQRVSPIVWTGPLLLEDRLVLGSSTGDLLVLAGADGHEITRLSLGEPVLSAPIAAGGLLFVRTASRVIAFR